MGDGLETAGVGAFNNGDTTSRLNRPSPERVSGRQPPHVEQGSWKPACSERLPGCSLEALHGTKMSATVWKRRGSAPFTMGIRHVAGIDHVLNRGVPRQPGTLWGTMKVGPSGLVKVLLEMGPPPI